MLVELLITSHTSSQHVAKILTVKLQLIEEILVIFSFLFYFKRTEEFQLEKESELRFEVESGATVQLEVSLISRIPVMLTN